MVYYLLSPDGAGVVKISLSLARYLTTHCRKIPISIINVSEVYNVQYLYVNVICLL